MGHSFLSALVLLLVIDPCCSAPIFVLGDTQRRAAAAHGLVLGGHAVAGPMLITVAWQ